MWHVGGGHANCTTLSRSQADSCDINWSHKNWSVLIAIFSKNGPKQLIAAMQFADRPHLHVSIIPLEG